MSDKYVIKMCPTKSMSNLTRENKYQNKFFVKDSFQAEEIFELVEIPKFIKMVEMIKQIYSQLSRSNAAEGVLYRSCDSRSH